MEAELDWGKTLSLFITNTEARIADTKKIIQDFYRAKDWTSPEQKKEVIDELRVLQKEEERILDRLVKEKTSQNQGR